MPTTHVTHEWHEILEGHTAHGTCRRLLRGLTQERQAFGSDTQLTLCLDIRLHYRGRDPHELTQKQKLSRSIASGWLEFDEWCEGFSDLFARTSLSESDPK